MTLKKANQRINSELFGILLFIVSTAFALYLAYFSCWHYHTFLREWICYGAFWIVGAPQKPLSVPGLPDYEVANYKDNQERTVPGV